jgi:hypothetical protein
MKCVARLFSRGNENRRMLTVLNRLADFVTVTDLTYAQMFQVYDITYGNIYRTVTSLAIASTFLVLVTNSL